MGVLFDGSNDGYDYGDQTALDGAAALSVVLDVCPVATGNNLRHFGRSGGSQVGFEINETTGGVLSVRFNTGPIDGNLAGAFVNGTPISLAIRFDGSQGSNATRLVVIANGVAQTLSFNGTIPATIPSASSGKLTLGYNSTAANFTSARYSNLKVWLAALTNAELINEAQVLRPIRTANLFLWDPLTDNAGKDLSGNGRNATLVDAPARNHYAFGIPWGATVEAA